MIKKILLRIKLLGFKNTLITILFKILSFFSILKYKRKIYEKKLLKIKSTKKKFTKIYMDNYWLDSESKSGSGSSLSSTQNIRFHLPVIFKKFKINKVFDAPCGDFNWMFHVLKKNNNIDYLGADIVEKLIFINKKKFENNRIKFKKLDIRLDKLPNSDLMICRDCLFHFCYKDIFLFLKNFLSSKIKYILLTSNLNLEHKFKNKDIITGDFRLIDLFSEPFNFNKNFIYAFNDKDIQEIYYYKQMYLFSKKQIQQSLKENMNIRP
jgi:hypothetical protein